MDGARLEILERADRRQRERPRKQQRYGSEKREDEQYVVEKTELRRGIHDEPPLNHERQLARRGGSQQAN